MTCMFEDGDTYEELRGVELVGRAEVIDDPDKMWDWASTCSSGTTAATPRSCGPRGDHAQQAHHDQAQRRARRLMGHRLGLPPTGPA